MRTPNISGRAALAVVAGTAAGALALAVTPAASAAPDPCAASTVAKTVGAVATNTGAYLSAHPETDQALTAISQQPPGPQSVAMVKAYFDSNPEVAADMQRLQQPLVSLSARCRLPVTLPQMLGLLQSVQQGQSGTSSLGSEAVSTPGPRGSGAPPGPVAAS